MNKLVFYKQGLLLLLLLLPSQIVLAQVTQFSRPQAAPSDVELSHSQLPFYLLQAFHQSSADQRLALNHIGIQTTLLNNSYVVTAALEGYPAHRAGIDRGDILRSVNGERYHPIYSFNPQADSPLFSANDSSYQIVIERNRDRLTLEIEPVYENLYDSYRSATLNSVQEFSTGNKVVGYVRFWGISRNTNDLIAYRKLIEALAHCDGLVIDLRNSYGFLDVALLDLIFPNRASFFQLDGPEGDTRALRLDAARFGGDYYPKPVAVLLNAATLGGAELFAYQLAKLQRVITVGEPTPGRIGDYRLQLDNPGANYRYLPATATTVDGNVFEAEGVQPEQLIAYPIDQASRSDPQFEEAIRVLLGII